MTGADIELLLDVLHESRRQGFLGGRSIDEVVQHSRAFVSALSDVDGTVLDLGSGGGVPGLVIAHDRLDLEVVLVDRRAKRIDFLERVVRRARWTDRVTAVLADASHLVRDEQFCVDAVVARGFGPPDLTLGIACSLVKVGGLVVISEPPEGDRWTSVVLDDLGVEQMVTAESRVAVFRSVDRGST